MAPILSKEQPPVTSNHLTQNVVFLKISLQNVRLSVLRFLSKCQVTFDCCFSGLQFLSSTI